MQPPTVTPRQYTNNDLFTEIPPQPENSLKCALIPSITSPDNFKTITINDVLNAIKTEQYKAKIDALPCANKTVYNEAKRHLPAWALNGDFSGKVINSGFVESNGLFHIDIDNLENPALIKHQLAREIPEIYALWVSPSGHGLKGLLRIPDDLIHNDTDFKKAFQQINEFLSIYDIEIDKACKDVRRLCFVCSDSDIYINEAAPAFMFDSVKWSYKPTVSPVTPAIQSVSSNQSDRYITRCCDVILNAGAGNYHNARLRAGKLAGGFIAAGYVNEHDIMQALSDASDIISTQNGDKQDVIEREQKTIYDAIQHGKAQPVEKEQYTTKQKTNTTQDGNEVTKPSDLKTPLNSMESHLYDEGVDIIDIIKNRYKQAELENERNNPALSHNAVLDNERHHCTVDFLKFVSDTHPLKQLALSIASATHLPAHTVFLMGLGVFASVACRWWQVEYIDGAGLPICLYVVAEQPSGTAKSRCLNVFQSPFYAVEKSVKKTAQLTLNSLADKGDKTGSDLLELEQLKSILKSTIFTTNSTPEALEQSLTYSGGFFSAVSSEQGLFNTMLGGCYGDGKTSNNDLLLNGFDGGYISSKRVGRETYTGVTVGGAVMFAQQGGIETLLKSSNGTGLVERFLLIAEPHNLGKRDHLKTAIIDNELVEKYNAVCVRFAQYAIATPADFDDLTRLVICQDGWRIIAEYRNSIEHHLEDGGRYSHVSIRGAAAKINMQIMKIAANLHLLADYKNNTAIDLMHVQSAIAIAHAMIEANLKLCTDKGLIGVKAEYSAILSLFEANSKPRSAREIIHSKSKAEPFKSFTGNKSKLIKDTLTDMVTDKLLRETVEHHIKLYRLAQ